MAPVVAAEAFEIEAAFVIPYKLSHGTEIRTRAVVLKLTDADGVEGWGEANPNPLFSRQSAADAGRSLKNTYLPAVLASADPEPGRIDVELDALLAQQLYAKGAISMALLDLLGRRLRAPVSMLLGGAIRSSLPVMWPLGNGVATDDIRIIDEKASQGFLSFGLKMGAAPVRDEIQRVAALEARYGNRIKFMADANEGWTRDESREFLVGVSGSQLVFAEQPVVKEDFEGMALLAGDSKIPVSADESVTGLAEAAQLAKLGAAKVFSIKSSKNGGPLRAHRIASVAEAFGISCFMNSMLEFGITQSASLQHAATVRNLVDIGHAFMSPLRLSEDPTDFSSFVRNGIAHIPNRPGLGVQVDEGHVRRMAVDSFRLEAPR